MAVARTTYNTLVDDDGSGLVGTPTTKAVIDGLLDDVDTGIAGLTSDGTKVTQVAFPATQAASADPNTLDDYEEGLWTPTLLGSTSGAATYTSQYGAYIKNGQLVVATFNVVAATIGTLVGSLQLGGLPYTVNNLHASYAPTGSMCYWASGGSSLTTLLSIATINTTRASFFGANGSATGLSAVAVGFVGAGTNIAGQLIYRASA